MSRFLQGFRSNFEDINWHAVGQFAGMCSVVAAVIGAVVAAGLIAERIF